MAILIRLMMKHSLKCSMEQRKFMLLNKQISLICLRLTDQLKRLEESIEQADEGKIITHEEAMKISLQWLIK